LETERGKYNREELEGGNLESLMPAPRKQYIAKQIGLTIKNPMNIEATSK